MTVKAIFKGEDGSLGYETGKEYDLDFHIFGGALFINEVKKFNRYGAPVFRTGSQCPYASIKAFVDNWEVTG